MASKLGPYLRPLLLLLALFLIIEGFWGPQFAPENLSTLFVWVHFRGLLVVAVLIAGNLFCAGCPLVFVRNIARRFHSPRLNWPVRLQNKWIAITLFLALLFFYERASLWASPWKTAALIAAYF